MYVFIWLYGVGAARNQTAKQWETLCKTIFVKTKISHFLFIFIYILATQNFFQIRIRTWRTPSSSVFLRQLGRWSCWDLIFDLWPWPRNLFSSVPRRNSDGSFGENPSVKRQISGKQHPRRTDSRTHGRTTWKHNASCTAERWRGSIKIHNLTHKMDLKAFLKFTC